MDSQVSVFQLLDLTDFSGNKLLPGSRNSEHALPYQLHCLDPGSQNIYGLRLYVAMDYLPSLFRAVPGCLCLCADHHKLRATTGTIPGRVHTDIYGLCYPMSSDLRQLCSNGLYLTQDHESAFSYDEWRFNPRLLYFFSERELHVGPGLYVYFHLPCYLHRVEYHLGYYGGGLLRF